jgi:hypothetical protein
MVEVVIGRQMASHKCTHQAATARPSPGNKHAYPLPTLYPLPPASPPQPIGLMHEASRTAVSHQASSVAKLRQSPSFVRSQASSVIKLRELRQPSTFVRLQTGSECVDRVPEFTRRQFTRRPPRRQVQRPVPLRLPQPVLQPAPPLVHSLQSPVSPRPAPSA